MGNQNDSYRGFSKIEFERIMSMFSALEESASQRCKNRDELDTVRKAFEFANEAQKGMRRSSGEPYIIHSIEVAKVVVSEIGLGYKSISAALMHDVIENSDYTVDDISTIFGEKIASLVNGLAMIKKVLDDEDRINPFSDDIESIQSDSLKRILLTMGDDLRVLLVKLADRLCNCRTFDSVPPYLREKILSETIHIFIPLAHRLGLNAIKSEMEDIWLRYSHPDEYKDISSRISDNVSRRHQLIDEFIAPISEAMDAAGYKYVIKKRIKSPYSIWHKMNSKHVPFEEVYDLYAIRIIFEPSELIPDAEHNQAYIIYAIVTKLYKDNPSRTRDWIKEPKSNGYEALHCTLMSHSGIWIEVQIRSRMMDDIAEKGIAAHWAYKNDGYITDSDSRIDMWLAQVQEVLSESDLDRLDVLDILHSGLQTNEITVFTPKGEQKSIMNGATVLDFAYLIHTHIGNSAIAAKINGKLVPLSRILKAGDQIEIISAHNATPKKEWLTFLKTRNARKHVSDYLKVNDPLFEEDVCSGNNSARISFTFDHTDPDALAGLLEKIKQIEGVHDVSYS